MSHDGQLTLTLTLALTLTLTLAPTRSDSSSRWSLNGQQFTSDAVPFTYYDEALLHSLLPASGPHHGGTRVLIHATHLDNASDARCRF